MVPRGAGRVRHGVHGDDRPSRRGQRASAPPIARSRSARCSTRRHGPHDFIRPGHVFPLRACDGGVLDRRGHTEAAVDLARLAGLAPVAVICEVLHDDGSPARLPYLELFAQEHRIAMISVEQIAEYRLGIDDIETYGAPAPALSRLVRAPVRRCKDRRMSEPKTTELASGLGFPEGPVWMPDGTVLVVEMKHGRITRVAPRRSQGNRGRARGQPERSRRSGPTVRCTCATAAAGTTTRSASSRSRRPSCPRTTSGGRIERVDLDDGRREGPLQGVRRQPADRPERSRVRRARRHVVHRSRAA